MFCIFRSLQKTAWHLRGQRIELRSSQISSQSGLRPMLPLHAAQPKLARGCSDDLV